MPELSTDVLIVGAGGAGMYAAISAARNGASVILLDKSLVGRGGATVMAQMTVAAALGQQEPDHWTLHLEDTLKAGRGLCNEELAALVCEAGPQRIFEMESWGTRWAREDNHIKQEMAPGHSRRRCCYVDFLNTGPAVAATLRRKVGRGLCNEELAVLVCEAGPQRIFEMESWGTRWAREDDHIKQELAPGHSRRRCCYVDFL